MKKWMERRAGLTFIEIILFFVVMGTVGITEMKSDWRSLTMFVVTMVCGFLWGMATAVYQEMVRDGDL